MVTWGSNTVHTFGSTPAGYGAPAPPSSGGFSFSPSSTPAPSFSFGSTSATTPAPPSTGFSFGSPTPAPSSTGFSFASSSSTSPAPLSGGLFGNPAPAPGGSSLFGATAPSTGFFGAPAPSGGLFGAPAPTGSLFGAPSPAPGSLFGAPSMGFGAPSPFGAPQQQQQQQQQQMQQQTQLPAQAALQAHMDASARQEKARVESALSKIHQEYIGTQPASDESSNFVSILYNQATPEYQQLQWLHGMWVMQSSSDQGGGPQQQTMRRPVAPPRPPQVSERDWEQSVVRNPDHTNFMPVALVGAEALQGRIGSQQDRANSIVDQLKALDDCRDLIQQRYEVVKAQIETAQKRHILQRQKLLNIMQRVEVLRCYNNPLQPDEIKAMQRAADLHREAERLSMSMHSLQVSAKEKIETNKNNNNNNNNSARMIGGADVAELPSEELKVVLTEHREELSKLVATVKQDLRDLYLIQKRLEAVTAPRIAVPSRV
ncbi:hypothetical protein ACA910_021738 [Epithemia clementina (nom. ined.)]